MRFYNHEVRHWTQTAKECYLRGCKCVGCPIYEAVFRHNRLRCKMKLVVIELVRKWGITNDLRKNDLLEEH